MNGILKWTSPNGIPDNEISRHEASLWLLTQQQRATGSTVTFDADIERWLPSSIAGRNLEQLKEKLNRMNEATEQLKDAA